MADPTPEQIEAAKKLLEELEAKNNEEMRKKGIENPYE